MNLRKNSNEPLVVMRAEEAASLLRMAMIQLSRSASSDQALLTIQVRKLPEGVYLATSDDLPGLIIEGATREEIIEETQEMAKVLMDLGKYPAQFTSRRLAFIFAQDA